MRRELCTECRNLPFQHLVEHNNVSRSLRHANAVIRMEQAVLALVVSDAARHSGQAGSYECSNLGGTQRDMTPGKAVGINRIAVSLAGAAQLLHHGVSLLGRDSPA